MSRIVNESKSEHRRKNAESESVDGPSDVHAADHSSVSRTVAHSNRDHGSNQSENGSGGSNGEYSRLPIGAGDETGNVGDSVDHHVTAGSIDFVHIDAHVVEPQHVHQDVHQSAVQVS